ncbi:MAG: hypothetical protein IKO31_04520 [Bacteroidales bacterium]|nr:hypothetical protein [Bacteroidales bacterium]
MDQQETDFQMREQMRINQEIEQQRINQEFMFADKSRARNGWIVVVIFALIVAGILVWWNASAQLPPVRPVEYNTPTQDPPYVDAEVWRCALKSSDANQDGVLSKEEEEALTELNLTSYRIHMFYVKSYEDLKRFPHLKKVWLGETQLAEIDLSANYELELVCVQSDETKTITLAVGCYPQLITPTREGELTIRRRYSENNPNNIWYK